MQRCKIKIEYKNYFESYVTQCTEDAEYSYCKVRATPYNTRLKADDLVRTESSMIRINRTKRYVFSYIFNSLILIVVICFTSRLRSRDK